MDPQTHGRQKGKAKIAGAFIFLRGIIGFILLGISVLAGFQLIMVLQLAIMAGYLLGGLGVIADMKFGYIMAGVVLGIDIVLDFLAFSIIGLAVDGLLAAALIGGFTAGRI